MVRINTNINRAYILSVKVEGNSVLRKMISGKPPVMKIKRKKEAVAEEKKICCL